MDSKTAIEWLRDDTNTTLDDETALELGNLIERLDGALGEIEERGNKEFNTANGYHGRRVGGQLSEIARKARNE